MRKIVLNSLLTLLTCVGSAWCQEVYVHKVEVVRAEDDKPISQAKVEMELKPEGTAPARVVETDLKGWATFDELPAGDYYLRVEHKDFSKDQMLIKVGPGQKAETRMYLDVAGEERVIRITESRLTVETRNPLDGAVTRRNQEFMQRQVADSSIQGLLTTIPGIQKNSLGQTHVRGEHKSLSYEVDGVTVPIPLASTTSQPIDSDFLQSLNVRTGNLDGSQGGQTGGILEASTPGDEEPFVEFRPKIGNLGTFETLVRAGGRNEEGNLSFFVGAKTFATDLQFEAPDPRQQTLNNRGLGQAYMARVTSKTADDKITGLVSYQSNNYEIAQTPGNFAAGVRQDQNDQNTLAQISWKRKISEDGDFQLSLAYLRSNQSVRNNGVFTPFQAFDPNISPDLADGRFPQDPENAGAPYLPTTNLQVSQLRPAAHYVHRLGERENVKFGADADLIFSRQNVLIDDPGGGGSLPNGATRFASNIERQGLIGGLYFSHTLPLGESVTANYGVRADYFDNGINVKTGQLSPHLNLSWEVAPTTVVRASYNRLFQAPPLELDVTGQTFTLPQRVNHYELSVETELAPAFTGKLAAVRKDYRDQVDIGLLIPNTTIPLFAPVNFGSAFYQGLELSLNSHNKFGWNGFLSATLSEARPLTPGVFATEVPQFNDHDQRFQAAFGLSHTWENGLSAAADALYASGYPQDALSLYQGVGLTPYGINSERIDRFIVNLNLQYMTPKSSDGPQWGGGLQVLNLFDERPMLNFLSAFSGTRFVSQRRILLNGILRF